MTRSSSRVRPMTGSSLFSRASCVRLRPNWSRIWLLPLSLAGSSLVEPPTLAPAGRRRAALGAPGRTLVAGQELDDLLAHAAEVGAELDEHLGGDALALADQAEQDVLGADVVVAELQRLAQRQLEHLLRPGREGDVARRRRAALADDLLDLAAHGLERDAEGLERLGGDAFALVDEAEQDVLGADVGVVEQARFLLGEDDDPAGPVGEAFEHVRPFQRGDDVAPVYRAGPERNGRYGCRTLCRTSGLGGRAAAAASTAVVRGPSAGTRASARRTSLSSESTEPRRSG